MSTLSVMITAVGENQEGLCQMLEDAIVMLRDGKDTGYASLGDSSFKFNVKPLHEIKEQKRNKRVRPSTPLRQ